MRRTTLRLLAGISAALVLGCAAMRLEPARRPHYGGTLRVEMQAAVQSLDPASPAANAAAQAAQDKLTALVFDTLTRLDDDGRPQPRLAVSWEHDAAMQHWEFHLRRNVQFQDGTPVSPESAAVALAAVNPDWHVTFSADGVVIDAASRVPDVPELLAGTKNAIVRRGQGGSLAGTGPFRVSAWEPGRRAVFAAYEDNGEGRPFMDTIEVQMGRAPREQMIDLDLGKADLVEIPPEQARRAAERGTRMAASASSELLALVFFKGRPAAEDARAREAVSRAIDRGALWNFLLQKQGEPAGGLLPQWSSGTAFLFSTEPDTGLARQLWSQMPSAPPVVVGYDASDALERAVAERIAVNATEAGITISAQAGAANADARLVRLRMVSPEPRAALGGLFAALVPATGIEAPPLPDSATPEELYARERFAVDSYRVVPLAHLPEAWGLSARVKDWRAPRAGGWRLADVWLEGEAR
jgi:peptide/nickel transport system substrate-binding protein